MGYLPPLDIKANVNDAPHVVILGAGASLASFPNGDANKRKLPLMNNLVDTLGLRRLLSVWSGINPDDNFEDIYSNIYADPEKRHLKVVLEGEVMSYFSRMSIPNSPTLYDKLILSLRKKDLIATFNWDPLLLQAYNRVALKVGKVLPDIVFLHGNVGIGYCQEHLTYGNNGRRCIKCKQLFTPSPLLYPVKNKSYESHPFINSQWDRLKKYLHISYLTTIFGYSAPRSDVLSKRILTGAFSNNLFRGQYEIEMLDILPENTLINTWKGIIYKDYCRATNNISKSLLFRYPRRTCEAFAYAYLQSEPYEFRRMPSFKTLNKYYEYFRFYVDEEHAFENHKTPLSRW